MTNPWHKKQWWGFTDIGPIQIPPNPQYLILTDRGTGTLYWITFNTSIASPDGFGYVAINTVFPCNTNIDAPTTGQIDPQARTFNNCVVYDAYSEPIIGHVDDLNFVRLIVRNGTLGVSIEQKNRQMGYDPNTPPLNLVQDTGILGFNGEYVTLILDISTATNGTYAVWEPNTLTQTPNPSPVQTYD
jgi:hypothetical protein